MAPSSNRKRDSLAQNYLWASRATNVAMSAVVPAALGYGADMYFGTSPWLVITGTALGFITMMRELMRLTDKTSTKKNDQRSDQDAKTPQD
jgi:F0F1-type ATP synthase assembly protein I